MTVSFNLAPGYSLGDAVDAIERRIEELAMPLSMQGAFQGTAQAFRASLSNEPLLILAALITVYIVLGVLYESYIHPVTILSTLPSAGVGAILALQICRTDLSVIALIGIILLIGIVKKNAIMMIDFALEAQRKEGKPPHEAIYQACLLRFRPIMMTTMAALLGGLPLALGTGTGSELRRPLGIAIVGGLLVSQILTLYTTPVIFLYFDRLAARFVKPQAGEAYSGIRFRSRPHDRAFHPQLGRHDAADDRAGARGHRRVSEPAGFAAAAGRISDHPGAGQPCPARARRPWPPRLRRRWSGSSGGSRG